MQESFSTAELCFVVENPSLQFLSFIRKLNCLLQGGRGHSPPAPPPALPIPNGAEERGHVRLRKLPCTLRAHLHSLELSALAQALTFLPPRVSKWLCSSFTVMGKGSVQRGPPKGSSLNTSTLLGGCWDFSQSAGTFSMVLPWLLFSGAVDRGAGRRRSARLGLRALADSHLSLRSFTEPFCRVRSGSSSVPCQYMYNRYVGSETAVMHWQRLSQGCLGPPWVTAQAKEQGSYRLGQKPLPSGKRNPCHQETEAGKCQFHSVSVEAQQTHTRAFIDFFFFFKERKENEN